VDRTRRAAYLKALDGANDGDLSSLVRLFAELEVVALRSELERPLEPSYAAGAVGVAKAYADRLRERRLAKDHEQKVAGERLAAAMHQRLQKYLARVAEELRRTFQPVDAKAGAPIISAVPPEERASFWKVQLIRSAREVGFRANLADGTWWVRLHLIVLGQTLRYVAAIQRVGYEDNGVLAVTVFAEILPSKQTAETGPVYPTPALSLTTADSVTLVAGNDLDARWPDVEELVERTLAAAVDAFGSQLG
jgi:hypothetical protein